MTGYSGEFVRSDMLIPGVSFIQKPFTPADLRRKIRKMLADKPGQAKKRRRRQRELTTEGGCPHVVLPVYFASARIALCRPS